MADKKYKNTGRSPKPYENGQKMWLDSKTRYGVVAAYCICRRYLEMQKNTSDESEREFCRQLQDATASELTMTDVGVYRRSAEYAELDGEKELYDKSYHVNSLCAADIDAAIDACSYGDGSVDYKEALTVLAIRYGIERLRFVLGCEIKWDYPLRRYSNELYEWAREMNINENYGRFGVRTRPEFLTGFIAEFRKSEIIIELSAYKPDSEKQGEKILKNKTDFYISFYEQLALQGFQANVPAYDHDKKYIADISFKSYNIAHLTKTDYIVPNPYANIPLGAMEQLQYILRETGLKFTVCTEPPYDERICEQTPDGSYILAQCGDTVLACAPHHLFGYIFYTLTQPDENSEPHNYQTFFAQSDAARDFAVKSGLINQKELFTESELAAIHNNLIRVLIMPNNDLDVEAVQELDEIITKIQYLVPDFGASEISSELENESDICEGVEP